MLPILVHPAKMRVLLQGDGPATKNRARYLSEAGFEFVHETSPEHVTGDYDVVFIADFDDATSEALYTRYKAQGALVNVEDNKPFCDFHVPAIVRRGDLLLTVSTGAKSPRVARRVRMMLERLFPPVWAEKLDELGKAREGWREQGASFAELAEKSDAWLDEKGLLKTDCECVRTAHQKEAA